MPASRNCSLHGIIGFRKQKSIQLPRSECVKVHAGQKCRIQPRTGKFAASPRAFAKILVARRITHVVSSVSQSVSISAHNQARDLGLAIHQRIAHVQSCNLKYERR